VVVGIHFGTWLNSIGPSTEGSGSKHGLWVLLIVGTVGIGLGLVRVLFQWSDDRRRRRVRKAAARGKRWAEAHIQKQPTLDVTSDLGGEGDQDLSIGVLEDLPLLPTKPEDTLDKQQPLAAASGERTP
jgi:hypothetical protein